MKKIFKQIKGYIQFKYFPTKHDKVYKKWVADGGDEKFRYNFLLTPNSYVFDLGGYKGQWASDIYSRYNCKIFVFEPVALFAQKIEERFKYNSNIKVFCFGLGADNRNERINIDEDGSSVFSKGDNSDEIRIVDAIEFLEEYKVDKIDLMKINIEGGEYELLERLISNGFIKNITQIQVQFHDILPDSFRRMKQIHNSLSSTHDNTFNYEFMWENWILKPTN